ncbi:hypothetical protein SCHPADRAFT_942308 [Schizopora paradoxa]|uniref:BTB domain-containing protein n=1 Tax=Schizopora paradoxa TaxID=27342 RepID=A0A0H2RGV9_9AGAM|nr:hypothetical protein SCHPADRAFT_942308 [Schizopora paradoxa]
MSDFDPLETPPLFHNAALPPIESVPPPRAGPFVRYSEANEDTDILLMSSDDVLFHVNSVVMKLSSTVFKDMLSMPRPPETPVDETKPCRNSEKSSEAIPLSEKSDILCLLLDIIYPGRGLSKDLDIFSQRPVLPLLKAAGLAAVKYDMASALKSIRAFLVSEEVVSKYNAVQLYGIAWDLDFIDEAKQLSTETLKLNLNTLGNEEFLEDMNVAGVLKLQKLHRQRKIILINAFSEMIDGKSRYDLAGFRYSVPQSKVIYSPTYFSVPSQLLPARRRGYEAENYEWSLLMAEVSRIMEECSDGSEFFRDGDEFFYNDKFAKLRTVSDFRKLAKEFRHIFTRLPEEVDHVFYVDDW